MSDEYDLEVFWGMLLSQDAERIRTAWGWLAQHERAVVRAHLERMASEEGWLAPQRDSARAALDVIGAGPEDASGAI
ncbi:MAG: hypothetical protein AAGU78_13425 [Chloroflexota bacterium]|nr:hypothetical protein [Anaerolineae bacterium]